MLLHRRRDLARLERFLGPFPAQYELPSVLEVDEEAVEESVGGGTS
jgi:hypothetical protein